VSATSHVHQRRHRRRIVTRGKVKAELIWGLSPVAVGEEVPALLHLLGVEPVIIEILLGANTITVCRAPGAISTFRKSSGSLKSTSASRSFEGHRSKPSRSLCMF
jgi:hypothetical protein